MTNSKRSTSSREDSPANLFRLRVDGKPKPIRVGSGQSSYASCLKYDPDTCSWRTYPDSSTEGWPRSLVIFPRAGMTRSGIAYRRQPLVPRTSVTGSSLWATPTVPLGGRSPAGGMSPTGMTPDGKKRQVDLRYQVKMAERGLWPTPQAHDATGGRGKNNLFNDHHYRPHDLADAVKWPTPTARLADQRGAQAKRYSDPRRSNDLDDAVAATGTTGQLNPTWVEWLMGFPSGWTDLEDSETPSSPK